MNRLLPFRTYAETDVINMFALDDAQVNEKTTDVGTGDDGVFVKVKSADLNADVTYSNNPYLGKTDYPHVYDAMYSSNPLRVEVTTAGDVALGLTLSPTVKADEHGQSLLYDKQKRIAVGAVLPGQSTPILTRGIVTLAAAAMTAPLVAGAGFKLAAGGKVEPCLLTDADLFGTVIGAGVRVSQTDITDKFEGSFAIVKFG